MALITFNNGEVITASGLNNNFAEWDEVLRAENMRECGSTQLNFEVCNVLAGSSDVHKSIRFSPPDDMELIEIGMRVAASSSTSGSWGYSLEGHLIEPIEASEQIGSAPWNISRYFVHGINKPLQVLLKGGVYVFNFKVPQESGTNRLVGFVILRSLPRRL